MKKIRFCNNRNKNFESVINILHTLSERISEWNILMLMLIGDLFDRHLYNLDLILEFEHKNYLLKN